jgi:hypothetical protein
VTTTARGSSGAGETLPPWYTHRRTGRLCLILRTWTYGHRKSWRDGKIRKLEDMLNEFVVHILETAERTRIQREEREGREREAARRRDLAERVRKFEFAASVRRLVEAVQQRAGGTGGASEDVAAWAEWATGVAAEVEREAVAVGLRGWEPVATP